MTGKDNDTYSMSAADMTARMDKLADVVQKRFAAFDLGRWPPGTGNAIGVNPEAYPEHYVNGYLTTSEFPAQCAKYDIVAAAKPTGLFNSAASAPSNSSYDSTLNLTNNAGYKV